MIGVGQVSKDVGLTPFTTRILQVIQQNDPIANKSTFVSIDSQVVSGACIPTTSKLMGNSKRQQLGSKLEQKEKWKLQPLVDRSCLSTLNDPSSHILAIGILIKSTKKS